MLQFLNSWFCKKKKLQCDVSSSVKTGLKMLTEIQGKTPNFWNYVIIGDNKPKLFKSSEIGKGDGLNLTCMW